jgi:hypothetical protein
MINRLWTKRIQASDCWSLAWQGILYYYNEVMNEFCSLLNVEVLLQEIHIFYNKTTQIREGKRRKLMTYHYYMNKMWSILRRMKSIPDTKLAKLHDNLMNLNMEMFKMYFVHHL